MIRNPIAIATAQSSISKNVKDNGVEIRKLMQQVSSQGAKLIHFPEGAISGYVKSQIKSWNDVSWELLQEELESITRLAGKLNLWVILGCNHRLSEPNRPHNSLYVISSDGCLYTRYDKQYCSNTEINDWYTPGQELCIFEVDGWRFGCALCIEIQFPELFLAYAAQDIDCLLFSAYANSAMFGIQAQAYAALHNFWLSVSVPKQENQKLSSCLIAPNGDTQTHCVGNASSICVETLDNQDSRWKEALDHAKPWRKLAREGSIYHKRFVDDLRSKDKTRF